MLVHPCISFYSIPLYRSIVQMYTELFMLKIFFVYLYLYLHVYFFFQSYFYCLCVVVISVNWKLMTLKQIPCMRKHKSSYWFWFHRLEILLLYDLAGSLPCTSLNPQMNKSCSFHPVNSPYSQRNSMSHGEGFPTPLSQIWAGRMECF